MRRCHDPVRSIAILAAAALLRMAALVSPADGALDRLHAQSPDVCINELLAYPCEGSLTDFVELYNPGGLSLDLSQWELGLIVGMDERRFPLSGLDDATIAAGGYLCLPSDVTGLDLPKDGATVLLLDGAGNTVNAYVYGRASACGWAVGRLPDGSSTWTWLPPSPGGPNLAATATPTATATATPTPTVTSSPTLNLQGRVCLSEFLPAPWGIDWDGNGATNEVDEWIELANVSDEAVDLAGYQLDDVVGGAPSSYPYTLTVGTVLAPGERLVVFRDQSKIILNNEGDSVRLLAPDGAVVDEYAYAGADVAYDRSFRRLSCCGGPWVRGAVPSPGGPGGWVLVPLILRQAP